ncbi:MAG: GAF domain-containing sensor histidine kinase [Methanocella sp.]
MCIMQIEGKNGELRPGLPEDQPISRLEEMQRQIERLRGRFNLCKETERELKAANRALKALSRCIEAMTHATDEKSLLNDICHIVTDIGGYRMAWIGYAEHDDRKTVRPVADSGYESGYLLMVNVTWSDDDIRGRGPTGTAARTGKPQVIKHVDTDPRFKPWEEEAKKRGYRSVLGLPLIYDNMIFGALTIYSDRPDAFDSEEVSLLSELADELSYGIRALRERAERIKAEKALEESKAQVELYLDLMGHDINNMNQVALGFLEMALDKLQETGRLDVADTVLITRPIRALESSSALIGNVRKLQKERSGELAAKVVELNDLLKEVCDEFGKAPGRDVTVRFREGCRCTVLANDLLKDVFINIVGNSIKHSAGPLAVDIALQCADTSGRKACVVTIEDNGRGIPDHLKTAIFSGCRGKGEHLADKGLGLCIVRTLVEDYGGTVRVEDRIAGDHSQGCRFIVELPSAGE